MANSNTKASVMDSVAEKFGDERPAIFRIGIPVLTASVVSTVGASVVTVVGASVVVVV